MTEVCKNCGGAGMRVITRANGERFAEECECLQVQRAARLLNRAGIPRRYEHCSLENYDDYPGSDRSVPRARLMASKFVEDYPIGTGESGLLLVGPCGVGKTHLAVGILRDLMLSKGVRGLFCDYRELLKQIQNSYNPQIATTELQILEPVFNAEILVIDELGAQKPTDWVWDTVALVLNTRYNHKRTTIITTNFGDQPPAATKEESLGDRIGERMRSRLAEMCVTVEINGKDLRRTVRQARFA